MGPPGRRRALKRLAATGASLLLAACRPAPHDPPAASASPYTEGALRLDLRHAIASAEETFDLTRLRAEPQWGGATSGLDRAPDWGDYRLSVYDPASDTLIFRQGFDSGSVASARATTSALSVRLPRPRYAVVAIIEKRRAESVFQALWRATLDPADTRIEGPRADTKPRLDTLLASGPSASKVDLAILGDGYTRAEHAKFIADARRAMGYLFSVQPMTARTREFNVHALFVPSAESGVTDRHLGVQKDTAFGCTYGAGVAERTLTVGDPYALREAAAAAPYDFLLVLANARRYGGSAHFGGPAVVAIDSAAAKYLVLHELAHVMAGLADEYYVPDRDGPAYVGNVEPWNPNVTISATEAKWLDAAGAAVRPSRWNKARYERYFSEYVRRYDALRARRVDEAVVEKLMLDARQRQAELLADSKAPRRVGLFEGANGYAKGVYRSEASCIMFSLQTDYFCSACTSALNRAIDQQGS